VLVHLRERDVNDFGRDSPGKVAERAVRWQSLYETLAGTKEGASSQVQDLGRATAEQNLFLLDRMESREFAAQGVILLARVAVADGRSLTQDGEYLLGGSIGVFVVIQKDRPRELARPPGRPRNFGVRQAA
jgi:hypothetical protein